MATRQEYQTPLGWRVQCGSHAERALAARCSEAADSLKLAASAATRIEAFALTMRAYNGLVVAAVVGGPTLETVRALSVKLQATIWEIASGGS